MVEATANVASWTQMLRRGIRGHAKRLLGVGTPDVGSVRWGSLRRTMPLSRNFGFDRGTPIDRYFIDAFLCSWQSDVKGTVLEIKDAHYTRRLGGDHVVKSEVLDIDSSNPAATVIADLNDASGLPSEQFDCIILTQTLQLIYRFNAALRDLHRSLKPGGVLLMTVPGITPVRTRQMPWYWSFTDLAVEQMLGEHFEDGQVQLETYGNVLAATAFLYGMATSELRTEELTVCDPDYPVIIGARAMRSV